MSADPQEKEAFDSMATFLGNMEKKLGKSLRPLEKVTKKMGSSKFGKNVKKFGTAMKGMAGASIQAWKMEQMMKLMEPFMQLLKLFEIPIAVLSALLTVMVNEIFKDLIPYFIQFSLMLLKLMPTFKKIGDFLGNVIIVVFQKLYGLFVLIATFIKNVYTPLWEGIKNGWIALKKAWDESGGKIFGKNGFIAKGLRALMNIGKNVINGVLGGANKFIVGLNNLFGLNLKTIPLLAKGGLAFGPTPAIIGDNPNARRDPEVVAPLSKLQTMNLGGNEEMMSLLEENIRVQKQNGNYLRRLLESKRIRVL